MRKPLRNDIIVYVIDDIQVKDPLAKQIFYNLLEGTIRHDVLYKYFKTFENAFDSLKNETSKYALFTKISNTFDPIHMSYLLEENLHNNALIGHILDFNDRYYELHDQCFVINVEAYNRCGSPKYGYGNKVKLVNIDRSAENFHDNYTPLWIKKGTGYSEYQLTSRGSLIISKFLENGYNIAPFTEEQRRHKFFMYNDLTQKYGSYLRIETNLSDLVFNCATEPLMADFNKNIHRIVTPANGLQALAIIDKCPNVDTIDFHDINEKQIEFTRDIIQNYTGNNFLELCYSKNYQLHTSDPKAIEEYEQYFLENLSTTFDELKQRLKYMSIRFERRSLFEIEQYKNAVKPNQNTLYNFSNVLSYKKTYHLYSQIHFNLMLKILAAKEREVGNCSVLRGILPSSETETPGFCNTPVSALSKNPDPIVNYEWRKDLYEYYTDYLKLL